MEKIGNNMPKLNDVVEETSKEIVLKDEEKLTRAVELGYDADLFQEYLDSCKEMKEQGKEVPEANEHGYINYCERMYIKTGLVIYMYEMEKSYAIAEPTKAGNEAKGKRKVRK